VSSGIQAFRRSGVPALVGALVFLAVRASAQAPAWEPVTTELLAREMPGYGGLCGVAVDHSDGRLFVNVSDQGVFRSADQGKTWERLGNETVKGRTETPGCMLLDPTGRTDRLLLPTVYGGPVAIGSRKSGEWRRLGAKATHVDWCAASWLGELKLVLALKHESGGALLVSRDGGQEFEEAGKGFGPAWVFDDTTAVAAGVKGQDRAAGVILRTTDGGKSFQPAGDYNPVCLPRWHGKALYWLVQDGLIKTTDRGATWTRTATLANGQYGPVFGKTENDQWVLTRGGVIRSADGGQTWSKPIPLPEWKGNSPLTWIDYDPVHDVLYAMKMTSELYRMTQPKPD
jgi:photosystem II stability/assembly factor-like uncharacterized protein